MLHFTSHCIIMDSASILDTISNLKKRDILTTENWLLKPSLKASAEVIVDIQEAHDSIPAKIQKMSIAEERTNFHALMHQVNRISSNYEDISLETPNPAAAGICSDSEDKNTSISRLNELKVSILMR